ncbi:multidrug resistance protein 2-like [Schistocerca serialis cubense]|uniref:multidrug resistance protein 2-like n=1 Tax=Schistocerca serialis cubense TaxID=2023355 RepID=UPI00214E263C|nr:multidrug resistance protein 2-like [Schistocerca serialis cubense]
MKAKLHEPVTETIWYSLRSCTLFLQFRYAACTEKLWMFVGLISASLAGLCIPAIVILFGKLAEEFINFEVIKVHEEGVQRKKHHELAPAGLRWYHEGNSTYLTRTIIGSTVDLALYTIVLGFLQLLLGAIFTASLNYSAQRQVLKTRIQYIKAILKQDMGWFDMHSPHKLSAKVFIFTNDIYEGLAEKLGMMVYTSVSALAGFVVAFMHGWFLSLILVAVVPIILFIAIAGAKVTKYLRNAQIKSYRKSESFALDSLMNIRSVAAYEGYSEESKMYGCSLNMNQTLTTGLHSFKGLVAGVLWFFVYCTYAVGLYYGMKLAINNVHSYSPPTLIIVLPTSDFVIKYKSNRPIFKSYVTVWVEKSLTHLKLCNE